MTTVAPQPEASDRGAAAAAPAEGGPPRSSRRRLVFRSALTPVWGAGGLLCICFVLPLVLVPGCKGHPGHVIYPHDLYDNVFDADADTFTEIVAAVSFTWYYLLGLLVAAGTLLVALTRRPTHFRTLWFAYAGTICVVTLAIWLAVSQESKNAEGGSPELDVDNLWLLVPTVALPMLLVVTYFNCRTWLAAALWMQLVLASLSVAWFAYLWREFGDSLLVGGQLAAGASCALVLATLWLRVRGYQALGIPPPRRKSELAREAALAAAAPLAARPR